MQNRVVGEWINKSVNPVGFAVVCSNILSFSSSFKEIYAPKLQEFAYVTDGACSEDDIIRMELIILKVTK